MAKGLLAILGRMQPGQEQDEGSDQPKAPTKKVKAVKAFGMAMKANDWSAASDALDLYLDLSEPDTDDNQ